MTGGWGCWKCGAKLNDFELQTHDCGKSMVSEALAAIDRAKARTDEMGSRLSNFSAKIASYRSGVPTSEILNHLYKNLTSETSDEELLLVQQKARDIISRAQELLDLKKVSSCEDKD